MVQIAEDYVSFETAKLLKEKGFDECCVCYYDTESLNKFGYPVFDSIDMPLSNSDLEQSDHDYVCYSAPTLQMAMKWLREVHKIDIITPPLFDNSKWTYSAIIFKLSIPCTEIRLNDNKDKKEEAIEAAIKYCLENLI